MAADHDVGARRQPPGRLGEVDDLGQVGEVVAREGDDVRLPLINELDIILVAFYLQVDELDVVSTSPCSLGYQLETERLEAQVDLRVHKRTGMHSKKLHETRTLL